MKPGQVQGICKVLTKQYINSNGIRAKRLNFLFENGPGNRTHGLFNPHVDFTEYLKNKNTIQEELIKRKANNNLNKLENLWSIYEDLKIKKEKIKLQLSKFKAERKLEVNVGDKFESETNLLAEDLNKLDRKLWPAEKKAVDAYLHLPNKLHTLTPEGKYNILYVYKSKPFNNKNHINISKEQNLVQFTENDKYYLKNKAAIFELGAQIYFSSFLKENLYTQYSNTDFCKSFIVEACGEDHTDPYTTFILKNNKDETGIKLHLTGAASIYSFFCHFLKRTVLKKNLPLKYFAMGRNYVPSIYKDSDLFKVGQSSVIETFVVAENIINLNELLNDTIKMIKQSYDALGYHYRLSYVPAHLLKNWESLRLAIEMYSSSQQQYIEIGNVSLSGDFICKRLMFTYQNSLTDTTPKFPYVISGTILNVPRFLGCVLEQDEVFRIPSQFTMDSWCSYNVPNYSG